MSEVKDDEKAICYRCLQAAEALGQKQDSTHEILLQLVTVIDTRVGELINHLAGKDQVPLSVVKWLVIFMLTFTFSMVFGVGELKNVIHMFKA